MAAAQWSPQLNIYLCKEKLYLIKRSYAFSLSITTATLRQLIDFPWLKMDIDCVDGKMKLVNCVKGMKNPEQFVINKYE